MLAGYTTFQISQPQVSNGGALLATSEDTAFSASVTVKNTGAVAGDEVVFLYKKSDKPVLAFAEQEGLAPPTLPSRELIGFGRVTLAAGASTGTLPVCLCLSLSVSVCLSLSLAVSRCLSLTLADSRWRLHSCALQLDRQQSLDRG